MNPQTQALLWRSLLGLLLVEIPVVTYQLSQPVFDYRVLAVGLLGAAGAFLDKRLSPQLANVILPGATIMPHETVPAPPLDPLPTPVAPGPPTG